MPTSRRVLSEWLPVLAWAALIFFFSSRPHLSSGLGTWDLVLRKCAHASEFAVLGFLLLRALRREYGAGLVGILYAVSDEVHQMFVPGRVGAAYDVAIDSFGVLAGVYLLPRLLRRVPGPLGRLAA